MRFLDGPAQPLSLWQWVLRKPSQPDLESSCATVGSRGPGQPAPDLDRVSVPVQGPVLSRLALRLAGGQAIEEPFLQQELWSPNGKVLTVLMHPGRVKTGLNARDEKGPILSAGMTCCLRSAGVPLSAGAWARG